MAPRIALLALLAFPAAVDAEDRFVGGAGDPYATIGAALGDAVDGDVVIVRAGTYAESLTTRAPGVTIRADDGATVIVESGAARVLDIRHERVTVEGLILDAMFAGRGVRIDDGADGAVLRGVEVRNAGNHCVDLRRVDDVLIEGSLIHHCLASSRDGCDRDACRVDAHGVVGGQPRGLVIRDTEIHTFSGDAVQIDSDRGDRQWDATIEGCRLWSAPLPAPIGGYAAGVNPAENAIDTKTSDTIAEPARLTVIDTVAFGFRDGLIGLPAAYNIKENVAAVFDRVTVFDSTVAFRLRGMTGSRPRGARVRIDNAVLYSLERAVRYEDGLGAGDVTLRHVTLGGDVSHPFDDQSAMGAVTIVAENVLFLGGPLPAELEGGAGNLAVDVSVFVDAASHDYHLAAGATPIDAGVDSDVVADRDGNARPIGAGPDVGAYERCAGPCAPAPDAGAPPGGDAGGPRPVDGGGARDAGVATGDGGGASGMDAGSSSAGEGDGCSCGAASSRRGGPGAFGLAIALLGLRPRRSRRARR